MSVTILDVRVALNDITEDELADGTIQQKIDDSETILASKITTPVSSELFDIAIKYLAAYKSYIVSGVFKDAKFGPLSIKRDVQKTADSLKSQAEESIINATPSRFKLKVGFMFTDRSLTIPTDSIL